MKVNNVTQTPFGTILSLSENLPGNQVFVKDHYVFPSLLKAIDTFHQLGHSECCIVGGKKLIEEGKT
jgi:hypothetical protein